MTDRLHLTFPLERVAEPVVCNVAKRFNVVYSIRRAHVTVSTGWMDLEIEGDEDEIARAIGYIESCGVRVDPIEGDIVEG